MSLREAYKQKLTAQVEEQRARLSALKARAKRVAADGRIIGYEEIARAENSLGQLASKLKKVAGAGYHALAEMRGGLGKALDDLGTSTRRAASHISTVAQHDAEAPRARRRHHPAGVRAVVSAAARRATPSKSRRRQTRPAARPVRRPAARAQ